MKRFILTLSAVLALALAAPTTGSAQHRTPPSGSSGGGQTATPRGGGSQPSGGGQHSSPPPSSGGGTAVRRGDGGSGGAVSAPAPGGRQVYGRAVPRTQFPYSRIVVPSRYYGVSPWYYYSPYFYGAYGLGYWGWDPYWWGYPSYWGGGWGGPYYGGYYGGGYYGGGYYGRDYRDYREYGSIKLKVHPKEAEVYVDGYYMGQVDDFDGTFQHLDLESGAHKIEIRANGYQPLVFEMRIAPGRTVKYEGDLRPAGR